MRKDFWKKGTGTFLNKKVASPHFPKEECPPPIMGLPRRFTPRNDRKSITPTLILPPQGGGEKVRNDKKGSGKDRKGITRLPRRFTPRNGRRGGIPPAQE